MRQIHTRSAAWLLSLTLLFGLNGPALAAVSHSDLKSAAALSGAYILGTGAAPQVGSIGGEWAVLGLARSGCAVPQDYWDTYYAGVEAYVTACQGVLHDKKYTEYSRLCVALTAIGADPTDVAGYNLLTALGDYDQTVWQGINGPVWALIALDSGSYDMPVNPEAATQATRQRYIDCILTAQLADGGWSLSGTGASDPDITGMALQALAKYQDQAAVQTATGQALACMSERQDEEGGFASWGTTNLESGAQMLVALCELGIALEDSRFVKNDNTILDNLLCFRQADGSFLHTDSGANQMASEQGLYGLAAALRAAEGRSSLYRMNDVTIRVSGSTGAAAVGLSGKHADVKKVPVSAPGTTFPDIEAHENRAAIEAMASRGMINGKENGLFDPDATMTRAEFAAIVVRALGLTPRAADTFGDVSAQQWYAPYIGAAHAYGLINGKGDNRFDPDGTITRQEAAALAARAAKLAGMDTELEEYEVRNVLAQFSDYVTVAPWARADLAFCYREGILDQSEVRVEPGRAILRGELAQMLYHMLGSAKLL